ncbi:MAG: histidinol dehydrogenase [Acidobacteriota bacterium]|nr:histidinol dehydrogenase [Acidobacteriota bacterium]
MIKILNARDTTAIDRLAAHDAARDPKIMRAAARIVAAVRATGDDALTAYATRFDLLRGPLEMTRNEIEVGAARAGRDVRDAIRTAVRNVRTVAARQLPKSFTVSPMKGIGIEQRVTPLARVGCYVPAGRFPLPSSLIMSVVPARVAGVEDVIVVCPHPSDAVLAAAVEAGATRLFRIGGAHAIAALAYGTATVPAVQRITGPGNAYVSAAKAIVSAHCPIDFNAGPSEIVVISDEGNAEWIAADLIAQAEHDPDARAIFITTSKALAAGVAGAIERRLPANTSDSAIRTALARRGGIVIMPSREAAIGLVNRIAPEHAVCDDDRTARALTTSGTIFVGGWSAQAAGDYATGSNHILPTGGAARVRGGLSAADFVKVTAVQRLTAAGLRGISPAAIALAEAEGLTAHADSIRARSEGTRR